ncbi:hypothetical protein B0H14DRAFT_3580497 [Mycena olivaceomarginata]|nr:hypothetical protein B0H14DRAFT_3580497 [Mycena olivaceomarginata]
MHVDFAGLAQAIVHCDGEKVWLFWPATAKNLDWWGMQHPQPWIGHPSRLLEALDAMEGLEVMHVTDACAFIVPPFCIHAVIAFAGSSHTCVSFAHAAHWPLARRGLEFCKALVRNPMYPARSAMELVEKVVHETPIWERAMGPNSEAATYLAACKVDTETIYERHKNRNISSAYCSISLNSWVTRHRPLNPRIFSGVSQVTETNHELAKEVTKNPRKRRKIQFLLPCDASHQTFDR